MSTVGLSVLIGLLAVSAALWTHMRWVLASRLQAKSLQTARALTRAIELRFPRYEGQNERVVTLARSVGCKLALSRQELFDLEIATYLRDLGLCTLPYKLLNQKPFWLWTKGEYELWATHAERSAEIVSQLTNYCQYSEAVRCHHVPFFKTHDPMHVPVKRTPKSAQILTVVTNYLWQERVYGETAARETLLANSGTHFDSEVVTALLGMLTSPGVAKQHECAVIS